MKDICYTFCLILFIFLQVPTKDLTQLINIIISRSSVAPSMES